MINTTLVIDEIEKVIKGKRDIIQKVFMAMCASGHILLEDNPGSGKTTLAKAFSRVLGLDYKRIQLTPDTMPSDITGYCYYNREQNRLEYMAGAVQTNLLLGDEINRTSAKTQSAFLEAMEEGTVTLDGNTMKLPDPFVVIATQNPITSLGTQPLPDSQCDRFMIRLSMGYPDISSEVSILQDIRISDNVSQLNQVMGKDELIYLRNCIDGIFCNEIVLDYICRLCDESRKNGKLELGISTRGALAIKRMACSVAMFNNRNYVVPEDIKSIFIDVCHHRVIVSPQSKMEGENADQILQEILNKIKAPKLEL